MKTLKVKINKEKFVEIESGKNELVVGLTQALLKKISKDDSTISDLISNKKLIKHFDNLCILCMFSSDMITLPIEEMSVKEDSIHFILKNETNTVQHIDVDNENDDGDDGDETPQNNDEENENDETPQNNDVDNEDDEDDETPQNNGEENEVGETLIPEEEQNNPENCETNIGERINVVIEDFCKNNKVYVVGGPRVAIHPNGVVFGTGKKLPILNDVRFYVDIEKQVFYYTYDMTEDDFINQLKGFLKKMLTNNFVFIWKKKCEYKEVDGKRYLLLYYTTRRYINQTKKLL